MQEYHEDGQTAMEDPNELRLNSYVDPEEEIDQHTVSWRELCGYFSASFHFKTKEDARLFFEAAKNVINYEVS